MAASKFLSWKVTVSGSVGMVVGVSVPVSLVQLGHDINETINKNITPKIMDPFDLNVKPRLFSLIACTSPYQLLQLF